MTVLFMDSMDVYSATADMETGNRWHSDTTSAWGSTLGARGGGGFTSVSGTVGIVGLGSSHNVLVVGFWWKFSAAPSAARSICKFCKGTSANSDCQAFLLISTARQLVVQNGDGATNIATGATVLTANTWYHIEVKFDLQNSGAYTVQINGAAELSGSGDLQNEATTGADFVGFGSLATNITQTFDDPYILNTSGSAPVNDMLGICYIDALAPTSDNTVNSTASTGTDRYAMLDETAPDGDTTYVSFLSNAADLYGVADLSTNNTPYAVQVTSVMKQDEVSPARTARNNLKSSSSTANGTTRNLTNVYAWYSDIFDTDPNGSIAWTYSSVNAALAGIERVS